MIEKKSQRRKTGMFGRAVLKEAINFLPKLPDSESIDDIHAYLNRNLHYNSEQTRYRFAHYITKRMFPKGYADAELRKFAILYSNTQALRDVCFYRFMIAEPLQMTIVEDIILPNLSKGTIKKNMVADYLFDKFPESKSIKDCSSAVIEALVGANIAYKEKTEIKFSLRDIPLPAFIFILHSEFPEPGIYRIEDLEKNLLVKAMLWKEDQLLTTLYEARNKGLVNKVSEIDSVRQFTINYTFSEAIAILVKKEDIK